VDRLFERGALILGRQEGPARRNHSWNLPRQDLIERRPVLEGSGGQAAMKPADSSVHEIESPSGIDLHPQPPSAVRLSKRAGMLALAVAFGVLASVGYGIVTRTGRILPLGFHADDSKGLIVPRECRRTSGRTHQQRRQRPLPYRNTGSRRRKRRSSLPRMSVRCRRSNHQRLPKRAAALASDGWQRRVLVIPVLTDPNLPVYSVHCGRHRK
jgi:hypothetical protein